MANTEIRRTTGSTPTNAKKFTLSFWLKKSKNGQSSERGILGWRENNNSGNNNLQVQFDSNDKLQVGFYSNNGNDTHIDCITNRQFRDNNSFYHFVIAVDSTQGTSSNRVKIYVNGVQETSLGTATYPATDRTFFSNDVQINVGKSRTTGNTDRFLNGVISHLHFTDGYAYDATPFGETDSTTGEWKIKTSVTGVTYGNNGFWWLKDSIATTDHSPNSNTFSVGEGTLTKTEDNPSNVFATLNTLTRSASQLNIINGNTSKSNTPTSNAWRSIVSTIGASTGKYYFEVKVNNIENSDQNNFAVGITDYDQSDDQSTANGKFFAFSRGYGYHAKDGKKLNNDGTTANGAAYGSSWTTNDIIGCAFDLDNGKIYWSKNGTWQDSGDPTSGSTGTGSAFNITTGHTYFPVMAQYYGNEHYSFNFGNGYFGTTAVSSAGTNASGNGIFEYDVPNGFTALSTKGLNL